MIAALKSANVMIILSLFFTPRSPKPCENCILRSEQ
jgi:hypothetical protein